MKNKVRLPPGLPPKHGGYTYLSTGRLPRHRRYIRRYLTEIRQSYVAELGGREGEDGLSPGQRILVDRLVTCLGFLRLIEEKARDTGIFKGDDLMASLGKGYVSFLNTAVRIVESLGIERRRDEGMTPEGLKGLIEAEAKAADEAGEKK